MVSEMITERQREDATFNAFSFSFPAFVSNNIIINISFILERVYVDREFVF